MESDEDDSAKGTARERAGRRPYDVGYGKPPKATRFGVRPQPQRRAQPPGAQSRERPDLSKFLDRLVEVKLNGRITKLHPYEALLHGLFGRGIKGQLRPIRQFIRECRRAGLLEAEVAQESPVIHAPKDVPLDLAAYVILREGPPPWDEATLKPYLAEYERDLARLKLLKEQALREARARGENVY